MALLISTEIKKQIAKEIRKSKDSLQIITAFCKEEGIKFIEENNQSNIQNKRILVRFEMSDILSGASDISIYEYCKKNNWKMYIRFDLHAKTYIFDNKRGINGSSNLTNKGLISEKNGNYEIASLCTLEKEDISKVNTLFDNAIIMDDQLFDMMKNEIDKVPKERGKNYKWSKSIMEKFVPDYKTLFTYDFPEYNDYKDYEGKSIDFLGLEADWNKEEIKEAFLYSKVYLWLKNLVSDNENEMYFGEITANLHKILVNDPKPYRKEVKELLARLLRWIQDLQMDDFKIDRPNYSQRIILK